MAEEIKRLFNNPNDLKEYQKEIVNKFSLNKLFEDRMEAIYRLLEE